MVLAFQVSEMTQQQTCRDLGLRLTFNTYWLLGLLAIIMVPAWSETAVLSLGYERGSMLSRESGVGAEGPMAADALQVDCTVARTGRCSIRSKVRIDDPYISAGAHRSESNALTLKSALYSPGQQFSYAFSFRLAPDWVFDEASAMDIIWQFKRTSSQPDMFVAIKGRRLVLRITDKTSLTLADPVPRGEWLDMKFNIQWSPQPDGKVKIVTALANGSAPNSQVYDGANMRDARERRGYIKWGLYKPGQIGKSDHGRQSVIWHDDIEVIRIH